MFVIAIIFNKKNYFIFIIVFLYIEYLVKLILKDGYLIIVIKEKEIMIR